MVDICAFRFELQRPLFFPGNKSSLCFPHAFTLTHFNTLAQFSKENHNRSLLSAKDVWTSIVLMYILLTHRLNARALKVCNMQVTYRNVTISY
jgi:hypothetical protein